MRRTKLGPGMVRALHARRCEGEKPGDLATMAGVSYDTLRRSFLRLGLPVKPSAAVVRKAPERSKVALFWTPERVAEAHALHVAGESIERLAVKAGRSASSLTYAFKRAGLPVRVRGVMGGPVTRADGHKCVTVDGRCMFCG